MRYRFYSLPNLFSCQTYYVRLEMKVQETLSPLKTQSKGFAPAFQLMFLFWGFLETFFFFELVFYRLDDFLRFFYSGGSQIFFLKRPNIENNDIIDKPQRRTIAGACAPALNFHLSLVFVVFLLLRRNFWVDEFLLSSCQEVGMDNESQSFS